MKQRMIVAAMFLLSCFATKTKAQVEVQFNLNDQPLWGPTGYSYVKYYYIPDIDAYYDVANRDYIYAQDGQWTTSAYLPSPFVNFDLYNAYKVVINSPRPWAHDDYYRNQYYSFQGRHGQPVIRDSKESRYWSNPDHPMHYKYEKDRDWGGNRPKGDMDQNYEEHGSDIKR